MAQRTGPPQPRSGTRENGRVQRGCAEACVCVLTVTSLLRVTPPAGWVVSEQIGEL